MEKLKKITAAFLLAITMVTTVFTTLPSEARAVEKTGACDLAGCDVGSKVCAVIETSILWGLITFRTTCYDEPKQE